MNVRGLTDCVKRQKVFAAYRKLSDILIMQETHSTEECENIWRSHWGGEVIFSHGSSAARGIAVFFKKDIFKSVRNIYKDIEGRLIIFDLIQNDQRVTICALYAPNTDTPGFFQTVNVILRDRCENKIIVGDFNFTMSVDVDRLNTYHNNNKARDKVQDMMDEFCLKDVWRIQNPDSKEYSWFKLGNIQKASRIDLALVSGGLDQKVEITMVYSRSTN